MMIFTWTIIILILFSLLIYLWILRFYSKEVSRRRAIFEETLWERRHRVPILLEGAPAHNFAQLVKKEIIDMRAKLQSEAYTLEEQVELERKFTKLLKDFFQKTELEPDFLHLSLEKEFSKCLENIRIAENDYNYALQKWRRLRPSGALIF